MAHLLKLSNPKTLVLVFSAPALSLFSHHTMLLLVASTLCAALWITGRAHRWVGALLIGLTFAHPAQQWPLLLPLTILALAGLGWRGSSVVGASMAAMVAAAVSWIGEPPAFEDRLLGAAIGLSIALAISTLALAGYRRNGLARLRRLRIRLAERRRRQAQYRPYLPQQANRAISSGKSASQIKHRKRHLSVFFSDIHRFTDRVDEMDPEDAANFLNDYLTQMCSIANEFGGTIDKFIGDSLMITFGDDADSDPTQNARSCLNMARAMQQETARLSEKYIDSYPNTPLQVRMGITAGYCTTGNFGSPERLEYTAIGKHVNLASRLENLAKPGEILVGYPIWQLLHNQFDFTAFGKVEIKGFARPVSVYRLTVDTTESRGIQQTSVHEPD